MITQDTNLYSYQYFANYGCGAYGMGEYGESSCLESPVTETTTEGSALPSSVAGLPDTGMPVYLSLAGGVLLIVIGVAVLITSRRRKTKSKR